MSCESDKGRHVWQWQGQEPIVGQPCLCGAMRYGEASGRCVRCGRPVDDHPHGDVNYCGVRK